MNVGTIGTGQITSWFLSCWIEAGHSCHAVYSRSFEKGEQLREKFQGNIVYTDLDQMMADERIEVVYIASPNSLHFSHAKKALLAGKHVILEKPFTSTLEECEELIQIAKNRALFLMEGITVVDLPHLKLIAEWIPRIMPIHMVVSNMSKVSSKYRSYLKGEKPNVFQCQYSGGALMDLNVYNLHFMTTMFDMPTSIAYHANIKDGIDFSGCAILQYETMTGVCIAAKDSQANSFVQIQGEKGMIQIDSDAATLSKVSLCLLDGTKESCQQQDHILTHYYYIKQFVRMVEEHDHHACIRRLQHTKDVMSLLVQARAYAGIVFEADQ